MAIKKRKKKSLKTNKRVVSRNTRQKIREREENSSLIKVGGTIISLALSIFIAISNFSLGGSVGSIVRAIILSVFGTLGYISYNYYYRCCN